MRLKSRTLSVIFKAAIVVAGAAAVLYQVGIFSGRYNFRMLNYFTVLSNTLAVIYFAAAAAYTARDREGGTLLPPLKGIVIMNLTVTMLVAHFMLKLDFPLSTVMGQSVFAMHYVVPVMALLDWLLFDRKEHITRWSPLIWTAAPLAYFAYAMAASQVGAGIGLNSRYPYPFLDVDALGLVKVLITAAVLVVIFVVLGYIFYALERLLFKLGERFSR